MTPAVRAVIGLPPDDTVRAFEARDTLRATVRWSEMWQEDHARAFTVAKVANLDLLAEIQASLADMLANGGTFDQWKDGLVPFLQRQGWWGDVADRDLTGTDEVIRVDARRLRTIYDTNLRVSRAAGRWKRIQELKDVRPFLRYTAVMDGRTRPEHRQFHGTILPVDHPWWDTHFPPCGWYCRCTVRQLSQRELDAKGWSVTVDLPGGGTLPFRRADGATVQVPRGIAPGWAYNPGKAGLQAILSRASRSIERVAAFDTDMARSAVAELVDGEAFSEFLKDRGGAFPVAVLDTPGIEMLRARSPVVVVPSGVLLKQDRRHGEVTVSDYRQLPGILHDPLVIVEEPSTDPRIHARAVFYAAKFDGRTRYYRVVVRSDRDEPRAAVVSFHVTRPRDIAATIRRGRLVLDRREAP